MNALVKKEIRLLLPSWSAILLLSTILPWVWTKDGSIIGVAPAVSFFGTVLIALDSFGREFSLGIFSSLMSQPVERREIWRNKIKLLAVGVAIIFIAQLASYEVWFNFWLPVSGATHWMSPGADWWLWVGSMMALTLVAMSGGLWTVLLLRQVAAAFWVTLLVPAGILMLIVPTCNTSSAPAPIRLTLCSCNSFFTSAMNGLCSRRETEVCSLRSK